MDQIVLEELEKMIQLAIAKGLIAPKKYKEIEFTVDVHGRASYIEFWNSSARRDSDRTVVEIPADLQSRFVFRSTAKYL
jgi:hypothetical protein